MWLMLFGVVIMIAGLFSVFGAATGLLGGGAMLAIVGFVATIVGLGVGLCAIGRKLQRRKP